MNSHLLNDGIKIGMAVRTLDGAHLGTISAVWPDSEVETSKGSPPALQIDREATDPELFTFSEGMPGGEDAYFRVRTQDGSDLYVSFSAVARMESGAIEVAVDSATIPGLQWDVMPDFINITTEIDSQGGPHVA